METAKNGENNSQQNANAPREKRMTIRLKRKQELRLVINDAPSFRLFENALRAVHDCQTGCSLLREETHRKHLKVSGRIEQKIEEKVVLADSEERTNRVPLARHTTANTPVVSAFQSRINFYKTRNQTASRERTRESSNLGVNSIQQQQQQQQHFYEQHDQLQSDQSNYPQVSVVRLKERVIGRQHLVIKRNSSVSRDKRQEHTMEECNGNNSMRQFYSGYESNSPLKITQTAQINTNNLIPQNIQQKIQQQTQNIESHSKRLARIQLRGLLVESESPKQQLLLSQNTQDQAQKQLFDFSQSKQSDMDSQNLPCNIPLPIRQTSCTQQSSSRNPRYKARTSISIDTGNNNNIESTAQPTSVLTSVNAASSGRRNPNRFRRPQGISIDGENYRQRYEHSLQLPQTPDMDTNISLNIQPQITPRCQSLHAHSRKFKPSKTSSRIQFNNPIDSQNVGGKSDQNEENKVANLLEEILQDRQKNKIDQEGNDRESQRDGNIDNAGFRLPPKVGILRKKETSRRRINNQLSINLDSCTIQTQNDEHVKVGQDNNCNKEETSDSQEIRQNMENLHPNNRYNGFQEQEQESEEGIKMTEKNEDHDDDGSLNLKRSTLEATWSLQNVKLDLDNQTDSPPRKQLPCLFLQDNNNTEYKLHFIHHNHHIHGQNDQNQVLKNHQLIEEEQIKDKILLEDIQDQGKEEVQVVKVLGNDEKNKFEDNVDDKLTEKKEMISEQNKEEGVLNQINLVGNTRQKDSKRKCIGEEESSTQSLISVKHLDNIFNDLHNQEEISQKNKENNGIHENFKNTKDNQVALNGDTKQALLDELFKDKIQIQDKGQQHSNNNEINTLKEWLSNKNVNENEFQFVKEQKQYQEKSNEEESDKNIDADKKEDDDEVIQNSFDESDRSDSQISSRINATQQNLKEQNQSNSMNQQPILSVEQCDQLLQILNLVKGNENGNSCKLDDCQGDFKQQKEEMQERNIEEDEENDGNNNDNCQENEDDEDDDDESSQASGDQIQSEGDQIDRGQEITNKKESDTQERLLQGTNQQKTSNQQENSNLEQSNKLNRLPSKRQRDVFNEEFWDPVRFPKNFKVSYIPPDLNKVQSAKQTNNQEIQDKSGPAVKNTTSKTITSSSISDNKKKIKLGLKSNNEHKTGKIKKLPKYSDQQQQGQTAFQQDLSFQADWNQKTSIFDELKEGFPLMSQQVKQSNQQPQQQATSSSHDISSKEHSEIDSYNIGIAQVVVEQDYEDWDAELTAV